MRREITGFSNPLLKEIRGLREKKLRKRAGLFLAERIEPRRLWAIAFGMAGALGGPPPSASTV